MSEQYIVSARKYRPDSFRSIVGQQAMSQTLQRAILGHKLAHAYLFSGPRGVGKTTAARVLAKTVNCLDISSEGEACNHCESCRAFNEQRSLNIFELDAASNNSVEDIRQLTDQVTIPPAIGKYKVYIIDEVHMLSTAAFNAFLKTLEEPPTHAIFILATTEKHKILPTILSRCQTYDFKRITVNDIAEHLSYVAKSEGIDAEHEALEIIAEKADGGMRDALSLFDRIVSFSSGKITYNETIDSLNILDYTYYIKITEVLLKGDYCTLLLIIDEILSKGFDAQLIVSGMASFMRDLLVVQYPNTAHLLEKPATVAKAYQDIAVQCSSASLFKAISTLSECDYRYREATNKRLHIELAFLSLVSSFGRMIDGGATPKKQAEPTTTRVDTTTNTQKSTISNTKVTEPTNTIPSQNTQQQASTNTSNTSQKSLVGNPIVGRGLLARQKKRLQSIDTKNTVKTEHLGNDAFDNDSLQKIWYQFIEMKIPKDDRVIHSIVSEALPVKIDDVRVKIPVGSKVSQDYIQKYLQDITTYIRENLNNKNITIDIEVDAKAVERIPLTAKERLEEMMKISEPARNFVEKLGLKII